MLEQCKIVAYAQFRSGKGMMQTFWLIGKHGSLDPHPEEPPTQVDDGMDVTAENPHTIKQRRREARSRAHSSEDVSFKATMSRLLCMNK
ncbi:hypothetical protein FJT64_022717 [Amphibalanus amphitrite]|uniref:Uncharacterized protein n=1 Tax=Amphibalanus amphitrite TaxID=1232801 RepID=A0A6A4WG33_AMPAM|nr:hypothetical protein FJT64_022717 [Amphibalanus amphitrite]